MSLPTRCETPDHRPSALLVFPILAAVRVWYHTKSQNAKSQYSEMSGVLPVTTSYPVLPSAHWGMN
eukprot:scaffold1115_cov110-Alexandrium_tamarense.AAC.2